MNYLQAKKKAMLNYVSGSQPSVTVQITTHSTSGSAASIDVTLNGVTTTYLFSQLSTQTVFGNVLVWYSKASWNMLTLGEVTLNGTPTQIATKNSWGYNATRDYEIIGNKYTTNGVRIKTVSTGGGDASVLIIDSDTYLYKQFDQTQTYSEAVEVYYSGGWKVKANQDVEYNGVTYHSGDMVEQWAYNVVKDIEITIL